MAMSLTRPVGTVISDNTRVDKGPMRDLINDLIRAIDGNNSASGRFYASRNAAVSQITAQALDTLVQTVVTIEGTAIAFRSRAAFADDPLFPEGSPARWGVVLRVDAAEVARSAARLATAVRDAGIIPTANVGGTANAITADITPTLVTAGVTALGPASEIELIPVAVNTAANPTLAIANLTLGIRNADGGAWPANGFVVGRYYKLRRQGGSLRVVSGDIATSDLATVVQNAGQIMLEGVAGDANNIAAQLPAWASRYGIAFASIGAIAFTPAATNTGPVTLTVGGLAQQLRDATGQPLVAGAIVAGRMVKAERVGNTFQLIAGGGMSKADVDATVEAERTARQAALAEITGPGAVSDAGQALIHYRENGRVAIGQKSDGLDFIPSRDLAVRMATGLQAIGFEPGGGGTGGGAPAGGWAPAMVGDELQFSGHAGPGLTDRFRLLNNVWRPTPRKARVLIGYGQSQSGIHQCGGEPVWWTRPPVPHHILTLDDMQSGRGGVRGHLGGVPLRQATALVPATTLVTTQGIQDIATAMAATLAYLDDTPMVYACRTEGRGGMPMIGAVAGQGIYKDSTGATTQQFANFIDSANRMVALLVAEGNTVDEITVLFDHAEADGLADVPREQYLADFNAMAADFEAAVSRPVHWLITQPVSGEGPLADNDWPTRLSLHDIGARANATLVCAKYDLPIGNGPDGTVDWVHTSYKGRVILGEYYAHADSTRRKGRPWVAPWVTSATVTGNNIVVTYGSDLPMRFDAEGMFTVASRPQGVELGGSNPPAIQSVTRSGLRQFTIACSAIPAGRLLRIGFSPRNAAHEYGRWPACTTSIRDDWERPARWVPGVMLRRWAWGQEIQL